MTYERICDQQRQPCPNPWKCGIDCDFNCSTDTGHKVAHGRRVDYFGEAAKELYIEMYDKPGNWWDKRGLFGKLATVIGTVMACFLVAVLVVPR